MSHPYFDVSCPACSAPHTMPGVTPTSDPYYGLREVCAACRCVFRVRFHLVNGVLDVLDIRTSDGKEGHVLTRFSR